MGLLPQAHYGDGFVLFTLYFIFVSAWVLFYFAKHIRRVSGMQKLELQFILVGIGFACFFGFSINLIVPLLTGRSDVQQFGPLTVLVMNLIFAYGMATRRI